HVVARDHAGAPFLRRQRRPFANLPVRQRQACRHEHENRGDQPLGLRQEARELQGRQNRPTLAQQAIELARARFQRLAIVTVRIHSFSSYQANCPTGSMVLSRWVEMAYDVKVINELVQRESAFSEKLLAEVQKVIVGQRYMVERILIGLLTGGHVLLEGGPGLAKTRTVQTVRDCLRAKFQRIQFTPDLLPADIVGTTIYNPATQEFRAKRGPIFANLVLADEINRAPAKVQSALLEAMQERQ